ncbi:MAG: lysophospholipid acyltransferase family protein [Bacteroidales bacterium]|nr:lysophospholipid acyltransferase family protein [Bacteroidales bacterium]HOK99748.1 lysophospholipid acyltransferase family protein [Bacteroidales bacterium]HPO66515.1 lysophospholipid acyltransferase family protein [Bacteroidales bacterium]
MFYRIRNTIIWVIVGITLFLIFIPFAIIWLVTYPFDRKHYAARKFTQWWNTFYITILPNTRVFIENKEKLSKERACIVISNHQSLLDIVVLFHTFAYFIWVSKIENFRVPVLGWVMRMNGYISVKREDPRSFPKMFEDIKKALAKNEPVMMFPEGTRSQSRKMGRFKEGAFKAAIDNKVPIQPIVIDGSYIGLKKSKNDPSATIRVKVLDPVPYEQFPSNNPSELKEYFRDMIQKELDKLM